MISRKSCFCLLMAFVCTSLLLVALGYRVMQPCTSTLYGISRSAAAPWVSDSGSDSATPLPPFAAIPLTEPELNADFHFTYRWNLKDSPSGTEILGASKPTTADLVSGDAVWTIELTARQGKLDIKASLPRWESANPLCKLHARFCITEKPIINLRMPNTRKHPQRHFILACELSADYGPILQRQTIYMQELVVDIADGAADLLAPAIPPSLSRLPRHRVLRGAPSGLPERYCGTAAERDLLRYLHYLATVEDAGTAAALLPGLRRQAQQLIDTYATPDTAWPDCWGSAADTARAISRKVRPLLRHMQEHNCYNSAELADFVNGSHFSRIFGPPQQD